MENLYPSFGILTQTFICTNSISLAIKKERLIDTSAYGSKRDYEYVSLVLKINNEENIITDEYGGLYMSESSTGEKKFNIAYFPQVPKIKNSLTYKTLTDEKYSFRYNSNSLKEPSFISNGSYFNIMDTNFAHYFDPEKYSEEEFNAVSDCIEPVCNNLKNCLRFKNALYIRFNKQTV